MRLPSVEPASFDSALVIESFMHISDRQAALRRIARVPRPGGRLALTSFYERTPFTVERMAMNELFRRVMLNNPFPTLEDYAPTIRAADLQPVESCEVTDQVARYCSELAKSLRQRADGLGAEYGEQGIAALETICQNCSTTGEPHYLIMTAMRCTGVSRRPLSKSEEARPHVRGKSRRCDQEQPLGSLKWAVAERTS